MKIPKMKTWQLFTIVHVGESYIRLKLKNILCIVSLLLFSMKQGVFLLR